MEKIIDIIIFSYLTFGGYLGGKYTKKNPWNVGLFTFIYWICFWPIMLMKGK